MDPNANLESQLELARALIESPDMYTSDELALQARALAEHVVALHEWIESGGFLPAAWSRSEQMNALARLTNDRPSLNFSVTREPFGLPDGYWQVLFEDGFECGIAPDGSVSS